MTRLCRIAPLPKRLKAARKKLGISQKDLRIRIGMDPSAASSRMNHYEKGRHMPDFETMERIAKDARCARGILFLPLQKHCRACSNHSNQ